jgi:hypothetical protein
MGKYLQKISLRPYSDTEIWTGWELEGRNDELDGLIRADDIPADRLLRDYGVTEFHKIPFDYLENGDLRLKQP